MSDTKAATTPDRAGYTRGRSWLYALAGLVLGVIVGRIIPPPYPDGQWWSNFLTSPGFGGSVAALVAGTAATIAWHNSASDRRQKQSTDDSTRWWDRFTWAAEKAISKNPGESELGLSVLTELLDAPWVRDEDNEMALVVSNVIAAGVSNEPEVTENSAPAGKRKRWCR